MRPSSRSATGRRRVDGLRHDLPSRRRFLFRDGVNYQHDLSAGQGALDQGWQVPLLSAGSDHRSKQATQAGSPAQQVHERAGDEHGEICRGQGQRDTCACCRAHSTTNGAIAQQVFQDIIAIGLAILACLGKASNHMHLPRREARGKKLLTNELGRLQSWVKPDNAMQVVFDDISPTESKQLKTIFPANHPRLCATGNSA